MSDHLHIGFDYNFNKMIDYSLKNGTCNQSDQHCAHNKSQNYRAQQSNILTR